MKGRVLKMLKNNNQEMEMEAARWKYNLSLETMLAWGVGKKTRFIRRGEEEPTLPRSDGRLSLRARRRMEHQVDITESGDFGDWVYKCQIRKALDCVRGVRLSLCKAQGRAASRWWGMRMDDDLRILGFLCIWESLK